MIDGWYRCHELGQQEYCISLSTIMMYYLLVPPFFFSIYQNNRKYLGYVREEVLFLILWLQHWKGCSFTSGCHSYYVGMSGGSYSCSKYRLYLLKIQVEFCYRRASRQANIFQEVFSNTYLRIESQDIKEGMLCFWANLVNAEQRCQWFSCEGDFLK